MTADATSTPIFSSSDGILGGQINGEFFDIGQAGFSGGENNWPSNEGPEHLIDGVGQKYLNFGEFNTGAIISPVVNCSIVDSIKFWTANDAEPRDPASYELYGTNSTINDTSNALSLFTLISEGVLALPSSRNANGSNPLDDSNSQTISFVNTSSYTSYLLFFPTVKDEGSANSMQLGEVQVFGNVCDAPEPEPLLVAEYRFDEFTYSDMENEVIESINGLNGRAKSAQPVEGKICNAVDLSASGTSDYIILDENILTGQTDFSVSVWAKTNKTSNQSILSGAGASNNELIMWFRDEDDFRPHLKNSHNGDISITPIADDNWHHLVWTRQGDQSCIYRDKILEGCVTQSSAALDIQSLILGQEQDSLGGGFSSSQAFDGLLDELLIYHQALTLNEIESLYDNQDVGNNTDGSARICLEPISPVIDYHFDELVWNGTVNEVEDSSGNGNHALANAASGLTTVDPGQLCRAGQFDGSDDYIESSSIFSYLRTTATLSFWIKTTQTGDNTGWRAPGIAGAEQAGGSDDIFWGWLDATGRIGISVANDFSSKSTVAINDGVYRHIVLTRDSPTGAYKIYIDGSLDNSGTNGTGDIGTNFSSIGRIEDTGGTPEYFQGDLDEVLVFDSVLSDAQVSAIYTEQLAENNYDGSARSCPAVTCGTGTLNAVGIRIDSSGSNSQINTTTEALAIHAAWLTAGSPAFGRIDNDTYNVAASGLSTVDRIDFGGSDHDFTGTLPYPGVGAGVTGSDFLVHTSGTLNLPAGDYTIFVESDDGFSFIMDTLSGDNVSFNKFGRSTDGANNELRFENPTGNSNTGGSFTLTQDSVFDIAAIFFERGGGDFLEISIANGIRTNTAPTGL